MSKENWLSSVDAARILGYSQRHVSRLIKEGKLGGQLVGGNYITTKVAIIAFNENRPKRGRPLKSGNKK